MKKLKPETKLSPDTLDLRTLDTNFVIDQLEELIRQRELSVEQRMRRISPRPKALRQ